MQKGFLPLYVCYNKDKRAFECSVGRYAVDHDFHYNTFDFKVWCVPFPMGVSFFPVSHETAEHLRSCGNSDYVVELVCNKVDSVEWINYFSSVKNRELKIKLQIKKEV